MTWTKTYKHIPQYEFTSSNQHGMRYKRIASKLISCARLEADASDVTDMRTLILLSHHLDVPVHFNFDKPQTAYIEVMAKEAVL